MKINKFLSLVAAGMLALTTAATGAISMPAGSAFAATAYESFDVLSSKSKVLGTWKATPDGAATKDVYVGLNTSNVTLRAANLKGSTTANQTAMVRWSLSDTTNIHFSGVTGDTVDTATTGSVTLVTDNAYDGTVTLDVNLIEVDPTKVDASAKEQPAAAIVHTGTAITINLKKASYSSSQKLVIIDPDSYDDGTALAAAAANVNNYDGNTSYNWYVATKTAGKLYVGVVDGSGNLKLPANAAPALAPNGTDSEIRWTASGAAEISATAADKGLTASITPLRAGPATITASVYTKETAADDFAEVTASKMSFTVNIARKAGTISIKEVTNNNTDVPLDDNRPFGADQTRVFKVSDAGFGTLNSQEFPEATTYKWEVIDKTGNKVKVSNNNYEGSLSLSGVNTDTLTVTATGNGEYTIAVYALNSTYYTEPALDKATPADKEYYRYLRKPSAATAYANVAAANGILAFDVTSTEYSLDLLAKEDPVAVAIGDTGLIEVTTSESSYKAVKTQAEAAANKIWYSADYVDEADKDIVKIKSVSPDTEGSFGPGSIIVEGLAAGTAKIKIIGQYGAALPANASFVRKVVTVNVGGAVSEDKVSFDAASYTVAPGATTATSVKTSLATGGKWTYQSANESIATISDTGVIKGVSSGKTTVTATYTVNGKSYTTKEIPVTVSAVTVTLSSSSYSVKVGGTVTALATTSSTSKPVYSIADTSIATVNASTGVITGVKAGTTILTATVTDSGSVYRATATVTVSNAKIVLDQDSYSVKVGSTVQATATTAEGRVTYTIADTSIATVDAATGIITGIKAGTTTLTATAGTAKATAVIVVSSVTPTPTPDPEVPTVEDFNYNDASFTLYKSGVATYTGSDKNSGTVTIPRYVYYVSGGKTYAYEVTGIADYAFSKSRVRKVKIPSTVSYIGYKAFFKCYNLEKVVFEDASNIDEIDDKAFKKTKDGLVLKQKNGEKFDSDIKTWLEKTFKQIVIK